MFNAKPKKIADEINNILDNQKVKMLQLSGFDEVEKLLSDRHSVEEAAKIINEELLKS